MWGSETCAPRVVAAKAQAASHPQIRPLKRRHFVVEESSVVVIVILVRSERFLGGECARGLVRPAFDQRARTTVSARSRPWYAWSEPELFWGREVESQRVGVHPMQIWGQSPRVDLERASPRLDSDCTTKLWGCWSG